MPAAVHPGRTPGSPIRIIVTTDPLESIVAGMKPEQLPIPEHKLHGWTHFAGLYAGEHVAATEFVIGATFVALGATTKDILIGLLVGNILAVLSWTLITAPIAIAIAKSLDLQPEFKGRRCS